MRTSYTFMSDELFKIASAGVAIPLATGVGAGLLSMGLTGLVVGEKGRARIGREVRDPRLYSNLRGVLESQEDRVAAHKKLKRGKKHTVLSAMREGFTRGGHRKKAYAALTPAGRLRRSQTVGRAPGAMETDTPSIADQVKPKGPGFGFARAGANQGGTS